MAVGATSSHHERATPNVPFRKPPNSGVEPRDREADADAGAEIWARPAFSSSPLRRRQSPALVPCLALLVIDVKTALGASEPNEGPVFPEGHGGIGPFD